MAINTLVDLIELAGESPSFYYRIYTKMYYTRIYREDKYTEIYYRCKIYYSKIYYWEKYPIVYRDSIPGFLASRILRFETCSRAPDIGRQEPRLRLWRVSTSRLQKSSDIIMSWDDWMPIAWSISGALAFLTLHCVQTTATLFRLADMRALWISTFNETSNIFDGQCFGRRCFWEVQL